MEDLYSVLQCDTKCTHEQLKQSYKRLALQHHPDKSQATDGSFFIKLNNAWEILGNPDLRTEYDIKWRERCTSQHLPIQEEVVFSDFDTDDNEGGNEHTFTYPCRCGGEYILTRTDAKLRFDIICCETCSLTIRVMYDQYTRGNEQDKSNINECNTVLT